MLNQDQAQERVAAILSERKGSHKDEWVVVAEETIEKDWGWIVFYQSRSYLETSDIAHALAGNAPYLVNKHTGEVRITGTALPLEDYLNAYEVELKNGPL